MDIFEESLMFEFRIMTYEFDFSLFLNQVFVCIKILFQMISFFDINKKKIRIRSVIQVNLI